MRRTAEGARASLVQMGARDAEPARVIVEAEVVAIVQFDQLAETLRGRRAGGERVGGARESALPPQMHQQQAEIEPRHHRRARTRLA